MSGNQNRYLRTETPNLGGIGRDARRPFTLHFCLSARHSLERGRQGGTVLPACPRFTGPTHKHIEDSLPSNSKSIGRKD
jgi:hypothetical protein